MDLFEMVRSSEHPALAVDDKDRIQVVNEAAERLLAAAGQNLMGQRFHQLIDCRDVFGNRLCPDGCALHTMVRRGEPVHAFDIDLRDGSGNLKRVRLSMVVFIGPAPQDYRIVYHLFPHQDHRRAAEAIDVLPRTSAADQQGKCKARVSGPDPDSDAQLTRREREILRLLARGGTSRQLSEALTISPNTVRSHTQNILRKLGARSKAEAVSTAYRRNLL